MNILYEGLKDKGALMLVWYPAPGTLIRHVAILPHGLSALIRDE
jgi:hypothetical protein